MSASKTHHRQSSSIPVALYVALNRVSFKDEVTLSTGIKRAIYQRFAILFGMRLGAFFLGWLWANNSESSDNPRRSMFFDNKWVDERSDYYELSSWFVLSWGRSLEQSFVSVLPVYSEYLHVQIPALLFTYRSEIQTRSLFTQLTSLCRANTLYIWELVIYVRRWLLANMN